MLDMLHLLCLGKEAGRQRWMGKSAAEPSSVPIDRRLVAGTIARSFGGSLILLFLSWPQWTWSSHLMTSGRKGRVIDALESRARRLTRLWVRRGVHSSWLRRADICRIVDFEARFPDWACSMFCASQLVWVVLAVSFDSLCVMGFRQLLGGPSNPRPKRGRFGKEIHFDAARLQSQVMARACGRWEPKGWTGFQFWKRSSVHIMCQDVPCTDTCWLPLQLPHSIR